MPQKYAISKMSTKALGTNPTMCKVKSDIDPSKKGALTLCAIGGRATGLKVGEDGERVYEALTGQFYGMNLQVGEGGIGDQYESGKLFLPPGFHEQVVSAVKETTKDGAVGTVEFGFVFQTVPAENPIGYSYQAKNLMPIQAIDNAPKFIGEMVKLTETLPKAELPAVAAAATDTAAAPASTPTTTKRGR